MSEATNTPASRHTPQQPLAIFLGQGPEAAAIAAHAHETLMRHISAGMRFQQSIGADCLDKDTAGNIIAIGFELHRGIKHTAPHGLYRTEIVRTSGAEFAMYRPDTSICGQRIRDSMAACGAVNVSDVITHRIGIGAWHVPRPHPRLKIWCERPIATYSRPTAKTVTPTHIQLLVPHNAAGRLPTLPTWFRPVTHTEMTRSMEHAA